MVHFALLATYPLLPAMLRLFIQDTRSTSAPARTGYFAAQRRRGRRDQRLLFFLIGSVILWVTRRIDAQLGNRHAAIRPSLVPPSAGALG